MFRIIALIIFVVGLLISGYHRHKAETSGERVSWKEENPVYSVGTLMFIAFALMAANWFIGVASLVVLVMLMIRLPKEEEKIIERFGDEYRAYMKRTGRFMLRLGVGRGESKVL
jgi:Ca2+/Na+ antiporter